MSFRNLPGKIIFLAAIIVISGFFITIKTNKSKASVCPVATERSYRLTSGKTIYFITKNCTKRYFDGQDKFDSYFDSGEPVANITAAALNKISFDKVSRIMPWGPKYDPKGAILVKVLGSSDIYVISGAKKSLIPSVKIFKSLHYRKAAIDIVTQEFLDKYSMVKKIDYADHHPDYTVFRYASSKRIYQILPDASSGGKQYKYWIRTVQEFDALNIKRKQIIDIHRTETYPDYISNNKTIPQAVDLETVTASAITAKIIEITVDGAVEPEKIMDKKNWKIFSKSDRKYANGLSPTKIERFTATLDAEDRDRNGQNINDRVDRHSFYLYLPRKLILDQKYSIIAKNISYRPYSYDGTLGDHLSPTSEFGETMIFSGENGKSKAIKINQLGYSSSASQRFAYVGYWIGSGGVLPLTELPYKIYNRATKQAVKRGVLTKRGNDSQSGEELMQIDLSTLAPGKYFIEINEIGRSEVFSVGGTSFAALYTAARGLYHQRAGTELTEKYTSWAHSSCHKTVYKVDVLEDWSRDFPADTPRINPIQLIGGWYDAGDFDRRPIHLNIVEQLLITQEIFPNKLTDNLLNLPESGNDLPDIMDEALYGLSLWEQLQNDDGGVRAGVQTYRHPDSGTCENDVLPYWTYSANRFASYKFASAAGLAGRMLRSQNGFEHRGNELIAKAESAWQWAEAQVELGTTSPVQRSEEQKQIEINRVRLSAAGELFATTGKSEYQEIFASLWPELRGPTHYDTIHSLWGLAVSAQGNTDLNLQKDVRDRIIASADQFHNNLEKNLYRSSRGVNDSIGSGTATTVTKYIFPVILGYHFKPEQKYIDSVSLNIDYQLGANAHGISWITGLGYETPEYPLHLNSMYDAVREPVPGLPIAGPVFRTFANGICEPTDYWQCLVYNGFYPNVASLPPIREYAPWARMAPMNEFTVWGDMGYTIAAMAFEYATSNDEKINISRYLPRDYPLNPRNLNKSH